MTKLLFAGCRYPVGAPLVSSPGGSRGAAAISVSLTFGRATNAAIALEVGDLQREDGGNGLGCLSIMRNGSWARHEFQVGVSLPAGY